MSPAAPPLVVASSYREFKLSSSNVPSLVPGASGASKSAYAFFGLRHDQQQLSVIGDAWRRSFVLTAKRYSPHFMLPFGVEIDLAGFIENTNYTSTHAQCKSLMNPNGPLARLQSIQPHLWLLVPLQRQTTYL